MQQTYTNLERNDKVQEENHVDDAVDVWLLNGKYQEQNSTDQYPILAEHVMQPRTYHQTQRAAAIINILRRILMHKYQH